MGRPSYILRFDKKDESDTPKDIGNLLVSSSSKLSGDNEPEMLLDLQILDRAYLPREMASFMRKLYRRIEWGNIWIYHLPHILIEDFADHKFFVMEGRKLDGNYDGKPYVCSKACLNGNEKFPFPFLYISMSEIKTIMKPSEEILQKLKEYAFPKSDLHNLSEAKSITAVINEADKISEEYARLLTHRLISLTK